MRNISLLLVLLLGCPTADDDDASPLGDDDDTSAADDDDSGDDDSGDDDSTADDDDATPWPELAGALATTNAAGRSGAFFLPERSGPLPIAVLFHFSGGNGQVFLDDFVDGARAGGYGLVAPDSRQSPDGVYTWEVGTDPGEVTPDLPFAQACLDEVLAMDGVVLDTDHVLALGHSGGGSFSPYLASNDPRFTHLAVLHGGVFPDALGTNRPAAWLSTGEDDTGRTPEEMELHRQELEALGFVVELHLYPGGHGVSEAERSEVLGWWLTTEDR